MIVWRALHQLAVTGKAGIPSGYRSQDIHDAKAMKLDFTLHSRPGGTGRSERKINTMGQSAIGDTHTTPTCSKKGKTSIFFFFTSRYNWERCLKTGAGLSRFAYEFRKKAMQYTGTNNCKPAVGFKDNGEVSLGNGTFIRIQLPGSVGEKRANRALTIPSFYNGMVYGLPDRPKCHLPYMTFKARWDASLEPGTGPDETQNLKSITP
ncbi:hypothetical protein DFP73DRAFT_607511 [Morchella snyderi]|nr:hypothetical protein DFP73DRAFT_607511 [Morchella snyderi]